MFEEDMKKENGEKEKSFKVIDKRMVSEPEGGNDSLAGKTEHAGDNDTKKMDGDKEIESPEKKEETDQNNEMPKFEADFSTFLYSLNTQALYFLGKIPNPVSKKYEKDISMAKYLIDTIDMLSKKTKGNLNENEAKLLENALYDLRMAYISENK